MAWSIYSDFLIVSVTNENVQETGCKWKDQNLRFLLWQVLLLFQKSEKWQIMDRLWLKRIKNLFSTMNWIFFFDLRIGVDQFHSHMLLMEHYT